MSARDDVLRANAVYAEHFGGGGLAPAPRRHLAVLACMDARFDPLAALGLGVGDAHIVRNAGALASEDVVRSLALSRGALGTEEILVIGHTDCGLEGLDEEELRARLASAGAEPGSLEFRPFARVDDAVRATVRALAASGPLAGMAVGGLVFDVETGRLREVA